jgi:hypothetical protein
MVTARGGCAGVYQKATFATYRNLRSVVRSGKRYVHKHALPRDSMAFDDDGVLVALSTTTVQQRGIPMLRLRSCFIAIAVAAGLSGCANVPTSPADVPVDRRPELGGGPGYDATVSDSAVERRGGGHGYGSGN